MASTVNAVAVDYAHEDEQGAGELNDVLRMGPFHIALQAAISARGLSLETIQRRLQASGHEVSIASLSYWQRGRSRPERASSLEAVRCLDRILGLPSGSLIALLGPTRPRGRWANHVPGSVPFAALGHSDRSLRVVSDAIDPDTNQRLETISHHQDLHLDAAGRGYRMVVRRVLRARADGADRMLVMNVGDDPKAGQPQFTAGANCRVGRVVHDAEEEMTAAELLFHRPLRVGETYLAEYEIAGTNPEVRVSELTLGFRQPTRECVLQVLFHAEGLPARCYPVWQPQAKQLSRTPRGVDLHSEQRIEPGGSVHIALVDIPAGCYGLRWDWD
ncbi:hypothetical protein GCM10010174_37830 [Kutzneria viridogrisea]|uniref:Uncharacterized protein n=2 Tax=Kutzneria TaxID=43356 RepID=W5W918_9PSEU|nr:hypothetical protein [Kutzneria albida]AHH94664.1 hypothetical protein KALB_1291 [Kutzneria albida DSM 43870]MBA8930332.1 hypothetical protein [Kutzneria viridogrisea]